jgi:hypothetical protein
LFCRAHRTGTVAPRGATTTSGWRCALVVWSPRERTSAAPANGSRARHCSGQPNLPLRLAPAPQLHPRIQIGSCTRLAERPCPSIIGLVLRHAAVEDEAEDHPARTRQQPCAWSAQCHTAKSAIASRAAPARQSQHRSNPDRHGSIQRSGNEAAPVE